MRDFYKFYNWYLRYFRSKDEYTATIYDKYMALSYAVRTNIVENWIDTQRRYRQENTKRIYYVSLDYNLGKSLKRYIIDAGMEKNVSKITHDLGTSLDTISECEPEFELGNSPKGGIAHCIQETFASQGIPAMGYGLWYDYAQFHQVIKHGMQIEQPYSWKQGNHPWNVNRPEYEFEVSFGGKVVADEEGVDSWIPDESVKATPWDYPMVGYRNGVVNTIRFWEAVPVGGFHPDYFNHGDYARACENKSDSTNVTRYLFPDGAVKQTTITRIKQQYFLAASSVKDIIRRYKSSNSNMARLPEKVIIHLSDSKCSIMILEMLRVLQYEEGFEFDVAFRIVREIFVFSTTGIVVDEFEKWPVYLVEEVLPLHVKMVYLMNQKLLEEARETHGLSDSDLRELSLIEEGAVKKIRLGHLAVYVSNYVTGVSDAQTTALKNELFPGYARVFGTDFIAGSTGISIRRWLAVANQPLAALISHSIGEGWLSNNGELIKFSNFATDHTTQQKFARIKSVAKAQLTTFLGHALPHPITDDMMLILHVRRVHPSFRQTLQLLSIVYRYLRLKNGEELSPRTYLFGGYAAPSDFLGKQLIHLIHMVAEAVNKDSETNSSLQMAFIPNCGSTVQERLAPAADIIEYPSAPRSSSVGMDVLKFVVNGAVPLFGGNEPDLEIATLLGRESVFVFTENSDEEYYPNEIIEHSESLKQIFAYLGHLVENTPHGEGVYPLISSLQYNDEFRVLGAFESFIATEDKAEGYFVKNKEKWYSWALQNIARAGRGSLDDVVDSFYTKRLVRQ